MNKEFWKNKRVLITGNTGFKGSWLSEVLHIAGAEVYGYALENECPDSIFHAVGTEKKTVCFYGDICDEKKLGECIDTARPEVVFHLAAQPIVRRSYVDPVGTFQTNVIGTAALFNSLKQRSSSVKAIINVTTDKVYENPENGSAFSETDRLGGHDPYSASKACSEIVTASMTRSFFSPEKYGKEHSTAVATARAGNVIGGGDFAPDRLIPDCIRAIKDGCPIHLRNPYSVRPWQNVLEPVSFYIDLAEKLCTNGLEYAGAWNVGPDNDDFYKVTDVIEKMQEFFPELKVTFGEADQNMPEAGLLMLDSSKAREKLGFKSRWSFDEAVENTAIWYKEQLSGSCMESVTDEMINRYFKV
ncbi:MAG: CDP-glucose 4,6-dehydratase [Oscillospiraceae bacterium]